MFMLRGRAIKILGIQSGEEKIRHMLTPRRQPSEQHSLSTEQDCNKGLHSRASPLARATAAKATTTIMVDLKNCMIACGR